MAASAAACSRVAAATSALDRAPRTPHIIRGFLADAVVRFGGDEFVCGMQVVTVVTAQGRFESMRDRLTESGEGSASVGIAGLPPGESLHDLVHRAAREST